MSQSSRQAEVSHMNVHDSIIATAVLFETRPHLYDFQHIAVPSCGSPGCLIGWIAHFQGRESDNVHGGICKEVLGVDHHEFYRRVEAIVSNENMWCEPGWTRSAAFASKILRVYAATYYTPAKSVQRTDAELVSYWTARVRQQHLDEHTKSEELAW